MTSPPKAKLFTNGRSQAVRLPAAFRFEGEEVFIRRNPETGEVILSARPPDWTGLIEALAQARTPGNFLDAAERAALPESLRDPLDGLE
jgi:antitoxin VapB